VNFADEFDLRGKWNDRSNLDYCIADDKARQAAYDRQDEQNPDFRNARWEIDALKAAQGKLNETQTNTVLEEYVDYMEAVQEYGASSAEAMLERYHSQELNNLGIKPNSFTKNGWQPIDESRVPVWRIDAQYRDQDVAYQTILDSYDDTQMTAQNKAIDDFLAKPENAKYAIARLQRSGYELGLTSQPDISKWVEYNLLPTYGDWQKRFQLNNSEWVKLVNAGRVAQGKDPWQAVTAADVRVEAYDTIYEKYKDSFKAYETAGEKYSQMSVGELDRLRPSGVSIGDWQDKTPSQRREALASLDRQKIFSQSPAFKEAYYRRKAYGDFWEEKHVANYVTYALLPDKGYAKERFLKAHQDFYLYAKKKLEWVDDIDFNKVPSEKVEKLYDEYQALPLGKAREDFRYGHRDLDAWLVITKKVSRSITETYRIRELSPKERFAEQATEADIAFDLEVEELRKRLEGLSR